MIIDVIELTEEEMSALNLQQILILRNAQIHKEEMKKTLESDKKSARLLLLANGMARSSVYDEMCAELEEQYEKDLAELVERTQFNLANATQSSGGGSGSGGDSGSSGSTDAPYFVDYNLSMLERVEVVQAYYLSVEDGIERMRQYASDKVAREYLGDYYAALYSILQQYSI